MEKEIQQLKDEIMCYQVENERLEIDVRSKMQEIEQLKKMNASKNTREVDEEKKWIVMKKECDNKIKMLDAALKSKSKQLVEHLKRGLQVFFVFRMQR